VGREWGENLNLKTMNTEKGVMAMYHNPLFFSLVPEVGIEPTLPQGKGDFELLPRYFHFFNKISYIFVFIQLVKRF